MQLIEANCFIEVDESLTHRDATRITPHHGNFWHLAPSPYGILLVVVHKPADSRKIGHRLDLPMAHK